MPFDSWYTLMKSYIRILQWDFKHWIETLNFNNKRKFEEVALPF